MEPLWWCWQAGAVLRQQMWAVLAESGLSASRCDRSPRALCAEGADNWMMGLC